MALSNFDRVGRSLDATRDGLTPFVERELLSALGDDWRTQILDWLPERRSARGSSTWDVQSLQCVLWSGWSTIFGRTLGPVERNLVSELRDIRNRWAHQEPFSTDDAYRAIDTLERLLRAIGATQAEEVAGHKQAIMRVRFDEMTRTQIRRSGTSTLEGTLAAGIAPWREVITPHPDVASGKFQQAEFAADLAQVYRGQAQPEYGDPQAFFSRTFLTEGLKNLLANSLRRMNGDGGDPVVELQTNFGGGKTHSMLALYHFFSGTSAGQMPGAESVLHEAGATRLPGVQRAVLVGSALSVAEPRRKDDGTITSTLWGEMAHQLLGPKGYEMVAADDRAGTSPGSDLLTQLLSAAQPCLILIDEWVAFVRQLYGNKTGLAAGSFEANLSFVQALTEAAKAVPKCLVVASIPASQAEFGGEGGAEAAAQLHNVFARTQSGWRPATTEESFEIVRRRLFQEMEAGKYPLRDATVKKFMELYSSHGTEFPSECREADYERRLKAAYPIHPELFDRLYNDWSSLDTFQRTRGVLRLMATVIHALWQEGDKGAFIMPCHLPLHESAMTSEIRRYLEETWLPIIERDVDGDTSLPVQLDGAHPNLGRFSAARRVARTLFFGSAATSRAAHKGLDERHVKLGCVQPGEQPAIFADALRRLSDSATHLYVDGQRFWYSTQPSVNRLAQDRAAQQKIEDVHDEIVRSLKGELLSPRDRGSFSGIHIAPASSGDVPDERETRLVILGPGAAHVGRSSSSAAQKMALQVLETRGNAPRRFRNTLVFLVPDTSRLAELESAVRLSLAWKSIEEQKGKDQLNLDPYGESQAQIKHAEARKTVKARLPETYCWLLAPEQAESKPGTPLAWGEHKLSGDTGIILRAEKKLEQNGSFESKLGGVILRGFLDDVPLWRSGFAGPKEHVSVSQLMDDFALYTYLPRLRDPQVLVTAVREGAGQQIWGDFFAYAEGIDEKSERYLGLQMGTSISVLPSGFVVHPDAATRQLEAERPTPIVAVPEPAGASISSTTSIASPSTNALIANGASASVVVDGGANRAASARPKRFFGSVEVSALRASRDMDQLAQEIIRHLTALPNAEVSVTVEIQADVPGGVPEDVERTVSENCNVLKFSQQSFEKD